MDPRPGVDAEELADLVGEGEEEAAEVNVAVRLSVLANGLRGFRRYAARFGRPDVLHAHNTLPAGELAAELSSRSGIPFVLTEHSSRFLAGGFTVEQGRTNPFLHMGLHLAIREQVATDRPRGIADVHASLSRRLGDVHETEHRMSECLGAALWAAQRSGSVPDEAAYLDSLRRLLRGS